MAVRWPVSVGRAASDGEEGRTVGRWTTGGGEAGSRVEFALRAA